MSACAEGLPVSTRLISDGLRGYSAGTCRKKKTPPKIETAQPDENVTCYLIDRQRTPFFASLKGMAIKYYRYQSVRKHRARGRFTAKKNKRTLNFGAKWYYTVIFRRNTLAKWQDRRGKQQHAINTPWHVPPTLTDASRTKGVASNSAKQARPKSARQYSCPCR